MISINPVCLYWQKVLTKSKKNEKLALFCIICLLYYQPVQRLLFQKVLQGVEAGRVRPAGLRHGQQDRNTALESKQL